MVTLREELLDMYRNVRRASMSMTAPLEPEDFQVQPAEEVSPPKWNLGHTSWFFWQFILRPEGLTTDRDPEYAEFLNSYYHRAGPRGLRGKRGLITRPTLADIYEYRKSVDERVETLVKTASTQKIRELEFPLTVGKNHEQQHQELFYTEIKSIYHSNLGGLRPAYLKSPPARPRPAEGLSSAFLPFGGGVFEFGNCEGGFCWDNEFGIHKALIGDFVLSDRLVANREYLEFMEDGGYFNSLLWLSDGWFEVQKNGWEAPLYWEKTDGKWRHFTLAGMAPVEPDDPVCHVSFYEAHAFARWKAENFSDFKGARLPSEREWEHAARISGVTRKSGNFFESGMLRPSPAGARTGSARQMLGDVWEWTYSHYEPYPGFREFSDDLSEYNGKFMNNQRVLRGGSCVTPMDHIRISYRNFWPPNTRFQFTGIRLAKDAR